MNKWEREVMESLLSDEAAVLKELKRFYEEALDDIELNIKILQADEQTISRIRRVDYQKALYKQISETLDILHEGEFKTIEDFLNATYERSFVGTMYSLHGQGMPMILPIDHESAIRAVLTDSKLSEPLYDALGLDINKLKRGITAEITRGIAEGMSMNEIARNIRNTTKAPLARARTIARTESHRIAETASNDAGKQAISKGADVVKQWDASLDGATRDTHRQLDGKIVEFDEYFVSGTRKALYPGQFGDPAEDCNCRCNALKRSRSKMNEDELNKLKERAEFFGLDKAEDFKDFEKKYLKAGKQIQRQDFVPAKTLEEAEEYGRRFVVKKTWSGNGNISYSGLSVDSANKLNETLADLYSRGELPKLQNIQPMNFRQSIWKHDKDTPMAYRGNQTGELFFNPKIIKDQKTVSKYFEEGQRAYQICANNVHRLTGSQRELVERYIKAGRSLVSNDVEDHLVAMIQHEMGHHIQYQYIMRDSVGRQIITEGFEKYAVGISGYATKSHGEYIAESFCAYLNGDADRIDPALKKYFEGILI